MTESWNPRLRSFAAVLRGVFVATLTLAGACTEPQFVLEVVDGGTRDGGDDECTEPGCDFGIEPRVPVSPLKRDEIPGWALTGGLPGTYAMRARFYSIAASGVEQWHESIALAVIDYDRVSFKATLRATVCERRTELHSGGMKVGTRTIAFPSFLPERRYALRFKDEKGVRSWETANQADVPPELVGYVRECTDEAKRPPQPWRPRGSAPCMCPTELEALPDTADDCRVSDVDQDFNAGMSVNVTEGERQSAERVVVRDENALALGKLGEGRKHTASFAFDEVLSNLECGGSERPCGEEATRGCPPISNPVEFIPAPGAVTDDQSGYNCAKILEQVRQRELFQDAMEFPRNCR